MIELFHGTEEPDIPFLNVVEEGHPPADILFSHANYQPQISLGEMCLRDPCLLLDVSR